MIIWMPDFQSYDKTLINHFVLDGYWFLCIYNSCWIHNYVFLQKVDQIILLFLL